MTLLWPDMPQEFAQINLRQTLYRLRQAIPEISGVDQQNLVPLILADRQTLQVNPDARVRSDLDEFARLVEVDPALAVKSVSGGFPFRFLRTGQCRVRGVGRTYS